MCDSGLPEFPRADDTTLLDGHARGRAARAAGGRARRERGDDAALARSRLRGRRGATSSPRGRSSPRSRRSSARSLLAARPAPRCTSCTSARAAAWRWPPRRGRAAWTCRSKPARTICSSPTRTSSGSARWPSARRRCGRGRPARRCGTRSLPGTCDIVASDHSPAEPGDEGGRRSSRVGRHRRRAVHAAGAARSRPPRPRAAARRGSRRCWRPRRRAVSASRARARWRPGTTPIWRSSISTSGTRCESSRPAPAPQDQPVPRTPRSAAACGGPSGAARPSSSTAASPRSAAGVRAAEPVIATLNPES